MQEYTPKHSKHFDQNTETEKPSQNERRGYIPPVENPYLSAVKNQNNEQISKVDHGFVSQAANQKLSRKRLSPAAKRTIALVAIVFLILGVVAYFHRPVEIMVNGKRRSFAIHTTADTIFKDMKIDVKPGNFVSVTGATLKAKEGHLYTLKVNDKELSDQDASGYQINSGDKLEFADGSNIVEEHTTEIKEVQPKLAMQGVYGAVAYVSQWGKPTKQEILTGKVSGETTEGKIVQEGQDCIVKLVMPQPKEGKKLVALTFDDGPSPYTDKYLEILKHYNAKATFFVLGDNVKVYPHKIKQIQEAGHQIASHTLSHKQLTACSPDEVLQEIKSAFDIINGATGQTTTAIRPPYGAFNQKTWLDSKGLMSLSVLWTKDSLDWKLPGVQKIVSNSIEGIKPGDIILMHDGGGNRDQDVEALPKIIEALQSQGYTLVTLQELLEADAHIPKEIASCAQTIPQDALWPTEISDL